MLTFLTEKSDLVFWGCAFLGTAFFALRSIFSLAAYSFDNDFGHDISHPAMDTHNASSYHEPSTSFKFFSLHSISGFFMMFGWVGLACYKQLECGHFTSFAAALLAGATTTILTALLFKGAMAAVSQGAQFDITKTIGLTGTVYNKIYPNSLGKIQIDVDGVTREILARSASNSEIESFNLVKVIQIIDNEIVVVKEINS